MVKKTILMAVWPLILLAGCSTIKTGLQLKGGSVEQKSFTVTLPFEYRLGLVIVKVNLGGETYDFLLDTGAPCIISPEISKKLQAGKANFVKSSDSQGNKSKMGFVVLDEISIAGLRFRNICAGVESLNSSKTLACLHADGIVGSNLMRKAYWKIDYQNQVITISDRRDNLQIPADALSVSFTPNIAGIPLTRMQINGIEEKGVEFDTGFGGEFALNTETYTKLAPGLSAASVHKSYGSQAVGIYGMGKPDTVFNVLINHLSFGEVKVDSAAVDFSTDGSKLIGTKFFKNYDVVFDWSKKVVLMAEKKKYSHPDPRNYGLTVINRNDSLVVSSIFINSAAQKAGVQLGDVVVQMDSTKFDNIGEDQWCDMAGKGLFAGKNGTVNIRVLRGNQQMGFQLEKSIE